MDRRCCAALLRNMPPLAKQLAQPLSRHNLIRVMRALTPALFTLAFASLARAQGTIDFSGARTLMGTLITFVIYAGAVICFGGLIFPGIRMLSGRFQEALPGLFGALFVRRRTRMMRALFDHVPLDERLIVIEQPAELRVAHPNAARLEAVDAVLRQVASLPASFSRPRSAIFLTGSSWAKSAMNAATTCSRRRIRGTAAPCPPFMRNRRCTH
jgi:hypothetical protein